jgi:hypothetical protein
MSAIPGHPFALGADWDLALSGESPDWEGLLKGYVAAVDWPASMFWRELGEANTDAVVLLSVRDSAQTWWESMNATVLRAARPALSLDWSEGRSLSMLLERFTGSEHWDDPALLMAAYERNNAEVRKAVPRKRLLEWRADEGWEPICRALGLPEPDIPFPWVNRRGEWG